MRRLLGYMRGVAWRYVFGILCTFATAALAMLVPYLLKLGIDAISAGHYERLARIAQEIAGAALLMAIVRSCSRFTIFNCGRDIEYEIRKDLFARLMMLGGEFYERLRTGDLMSRMINDLSAVRMMLGMGVLSIADTPLRYILALSFMFSMNARLTCATLVPYFVLAGIMKRLTRSLMERSLRVQEGLAELGSKVQESLTGIHVIKAYCVEEHDAQIFRALNDDFNQQGLAPARLDVPDGAFHGGHRGDDRADLRRHAGPARRHDAGRTDRVYRLHGPARLADHLAGLDGEHLSAGPCRDTPAGSDLQRTAAGFGARRRRQAGNRRRG